jgi:hypothetical protein
MKLPLIAVLTLPLAACAMEREVTSTTIVASVTPEQQQACASAAASARGVDPEFATPTSASATPTGPVVFVDVNGEVATCKLNELGRVEDVTFG